MDLNKHNLRTPENVRSAKPSKTASETELDN